MSIARLNASPTARLWIGGSPCSGKSTIASRLSSRYGFGLYHCDEHWDRHLASASAVAQPRMCRLRGMSADEIWLRPVDDQVEDELALYQEQFPLILSDLAGSVDRVVVAEGAALLPECVAPLITDPRQAVWIYGTNTGNPQMWTILRLEKAPRGQARLVLTGQDDDKPGAVRVRITVNGQPVFEGENPLVERGWSTQELTIPPGVLKQGDNEIRIATLDESKAPDQGWFMLAECMVLVEGE